MPISANDPDTDQDDGVVDNNDMPTVGNVTAASEGNNYDFSGEFSGSILNITSALEGVQQTVINNPTYITRQETPPLWAGAPPMPPYFVGRDMLVESLVEQLTGGQSLALSAEGLPGVGKTALATALAHHKNVLAHFSDGVLWAGLGRQADVMSALGEWAAVLGLDESQLIEVEQRKKAVQRAIGQRKLLLVIDDAWELDTAEAMRCGGPNCVHLLTSRDKELARAFAGAAQVMSVPTLEDDPAFALLKAIAPEAFTADPGTAQQLALAVGGLPLALELLGGYLARPESSYFPALQTKALDDLNDPQQRLRLAAARLGGTGEKVTLGDTITLSLDGLREMGGGEEAVAAFYALGAFAPKPETFSVDAAKAVAECDESVLALLVARNLVEVSGETRDRLALHQTLADVARVGMDEAAAKRHRDYYLALANEDPEDWRRIGAVYGQIKWAWERLPQGCVLDFVNGLRIYQVHQGLWANYLDWLECGLKSTQADQNKKDEAVLLNNIGTVYDSFGQWESALDYYERALSLSEDVGDQANIGATLNNIGVLYDRLGEWEKALDYHNRALSIKEKSGNQEAVAITLSNIGLVYSQLGQQEAAFEYYSWACSIDEESGKQAGKITTVNNIGVIYYKLGQQKEALKYFCRALSLCEEAGIRAKLATILNNIGAVYNKLGLWEKALEYYNRTIPIREELNDRAGLATTLINIGAAYYRTDQWQQAMSYYNRALHIAKEMGNRVDLANIFANIGIIYSGQGQQKNAIDFHDRALSIQKELGDLPGLIVTLTNIGAAYYSIGQLEKALEYYNQAMSLSEQIGDRTGLARTLTNIGSAYNKLGHQKKALDYHKQALLIYEELDDQPSLATTINNIGTTHYELKELENALEHFDRALSIRREIGGKRDLATIFTNMGASYNSLGEQKKALDYYNRALSIGEEIGHRSIVATTLNNLGLMHHKLGQLEEARDYYCRALPILIEVGDQYTETINRYNLAMLYQKQGQLEIAIAELEAVVEIAQQLHLPKLKDYRAFLEHVQAELAVQHQDEP
jgi:tetratricopeptide (TPR) repeat protein